jgi:hypothetical protein
MNVAAVVVTDEPTGRYNCLAWTLGITSSWIWPWTTLSVAKAEFDLLYQSYGFTPASSGPIAVFGLSLIEMTHGSISGIRHGPRWESKCGTWLRIQHGLSEMEGGNFYGNVLGFYAGPAAELSDVEDARASIRHGPRWESKCGTWLRIQHGLSEMEGGNFYGNVLGFYAGPAAELSDVEDARASLRTMKAEKLSRAEVKYLKDRVRQVDPETKRQFEEVYAAWKEVWNHPLIAISSNPVSRTQTPTFLELLSLGQTILPLLMEKLTDPEEFFALQAVDRLIRPEFVIRRNADDPAVLLGEQGRAIETIKQWVRTEA